MSVLHDMDFVKLPYIGRREMCVCICEKKRTLGAAIPLFVCFLLAYGTNARQTFSE